MSATVFCLTQSCSRKASYSWLKRPANNGQTDVINLNAVSPFNELSRTDTPKRKQHLNHDEVLWSDKGSFASTVLHSFFLHPTPALQYKRDIPGLHFPGADNLKHIGICFHEGILIFQCHQLLSVMEQMWKRCAKMGYKWEGKALIHIQSCRKVRTPFHTLCDF